MKKTILSFCLLLSLLMSGFGQVDTAAVAREVDSMMQLSLSFFDQGKFQEALHINDQGKELAIGSVGENSAAYAMCQFNRGRLYYLMGIYK